jgi:hypothetical protein
MEENEPNVFDSPKLFEYKALETRLYGELIKTCRRYHNKLSIISIVGILELISQEIRELEKTDLKNMDEEISHNREPLDRLG